MHKRVKRFVLEKAVEDYLVQRIEALGGVCDKLMGSRGLFDRVAVVHGEVMFIEVKRPKGGRLSRHQLARHDSYRAAGACVMIVKTLADVDQLIDRLTPRQLDGRPRPPG